VTYPESQARERRSFWAKMFRDPAGEELSEQLGARVVELEKELDLRRHQAQVLIMAEEEAQELGFAGSSDQSPIHQLIDAYKKTLAGIEGEALDLLPRVLVDMRRAANDGRSGVTQGTLAEIGEAVLPLITALGGPIDG